MTDRAPDPGKELALQETRWNGVWVLRSRAGGEDFENALQDIRNQAVAIHKVGSIVMHQGKVYRVDDTGAWVPHSGPAVATPPEDRGL